LSEIDTTQTITRGEFEEAAFEISFGDDAINKNYSCEEVLAMLRELSDKALEPG